MARTCVRDDTSPCGCQDPVNNCKTGRVQTPLCVGRQLTANVTNVNVKSYAFYTIPTGSAMNPNQDQITVQDAYTRIAEVPTAERAQVRIDGNGSQVPPPPTRTLVEAAGLTACGASSITVQNADLSLAGTFNTGPDAFRSGAQISLTACTQPIGRSDSGAFAGPGTKIYFGAQGDDSCGHPSNSMGCSGTGSKICVACTAADIAPGGNCAPDSNIGRFVVVCQDGVKKLPQWNQNCVP